MFNLKEFFVSKWVYLKWVLLTLFVVGLGLVMFFSSQPRATQNIVSEVVSVANTIPTSSTSVATTSTESSANVESTTNKVADVVETPKENVSTEPKTENVSNDIVVQDETPSRPIVVETPSKTTVQTTQVQTTTQQTTQNVVSNRITFIGDSLLANKTTSSIIQGRKSNERYVAQVGKHFDIDVAGNPSALSILKDEVEQGRLGDVLVIATATNSPLSNRGVDKMLRLLEGKNVTVYLVNTAAHGKITASHRATNNSVIQYAMSKSSKVRFIDVFSAIGGSSGFEKYASKDKIHFNKDGATWYANTLLNAVGY